MITQIIAQVLGIVFAVLGLSILFNHKKSDSMIEGLMRDRSLLWSFGFMLTTMGAVVVVLNNVWTGGLTLFVTIIGWMTLLKGVVILLWPNWTVSTYNHMGKKQMAMLGGIGALIVGVALFYAGMM
jgi:hypothetical protein